MRNRFNQRAVLRGVNNLTGVFWPPTTIKEVKSAIGPSSSSGRRLTPVSVA